MIGFLVEPLSQVPWLYVFCILLVSVVSVIFHSKMTGLDVWREISVVVRGVVYIVLFSLIVFSTVGLLKYASYLKIDIMQLSVFEFFVVSIIATIFISWKSLFLDVKSSEISILRFLKSIPYMLRQVLLLLSLSFIVYLYSPERGIFAIIVAVVPVNILYHLYRLGIIDKVFVKSIDWLDRVDNVIDKVFGIVSLDSGKDKTKNDKVNNNDNTKYKHNSKWGSKK
ncbi:MAG: hypothetical protein K0B07_00620 [DPANN group archaeon]|nr:hypothetical protein [DPANN group archaeon]